MSNRTTLAQLRTRAIREANLQAQTGQSRAVSPDEVNDYVNDSYSELHDLLVLRYGSDYFVRKRVFQIEGMQDEYPLPDDFLKIKALYFLQTATKPYVRIRLAQFMENERELLQSAYVSPVGYGIFLKYRCADGMIEFAPPPANLANLEIRYVYGVPKFLNDQDIIEMQVCNGWEEYIVVDVAIKMRGKLNLDITELKDRKAGLMKRIEMVASDRDAGQPQRVTDVYGGGSRRRIF